ncbi:MAG: YdeI/OmpD-associated family protein, partial [Pseudomonadota bacterium]
LGNVIVDFDREHAVRRMEMASREAMEKAGLKVNFKKSTEFKIPEEFQAVLDDIPELKEAFQALTPGRQRGYLLYFSAPKQSKTREVRIEKYLQKILDAKGLDD